MGHVHVTEEISFDEPYLVEGLPGIGLVGKIAADHVTDVLGMREVAELRCEGLPEVAVFEEDRHEVKAPVRVHADPDTELLTLQSDVPVSPEKADCFSDCLTEWLIDNGVTPIYVSGSPNQREAEAVPKMYGVSTARGGGVLEEHGIGKPEQSGVVSGPTGALIDAARKASLTSVGLVVETDPRFPDPAASRVVIKDGIEPITGVEIDTEELVEKSEDIVEAKERLAKRMQETEEDSTRATPVGMYQ